MNHGICILPGKILKIAAIYVYKVRKKLYNEYVKNNKTIQRKKLYTEPRKILKN